MKTAAEILNKHNSKKRYYLSESLLEVILPAMEEYARQFKPKKLIVAEVRVFLNLLIHEEITISKMVELLNKKII